VQTATITKQAVTIGSHQLHAGTEVQVERCPNHRDVLVHCDGKAIHLMPENRFAMVAVYRRAVDLGY